MRCKYFGVQELVPPEIYRERGERAWELLDDRLLLTLDAARSYFGSIVVNDWSWGGGYKESGLRALNSPTGGRLSQHRFGRAADLKPQKVTVQEMYAAILAKPERFPHLTTLEDIFYTVTPRGSWLHMDCRNNPTPGLRIIKP
jgi:hypothetical protein